MSTPPAVNGTPFVAAFDVPLAHTLLLEKAEPFTSIGMASRVAQAKPKRKKKNERTESDECGVCETASGIVSCTTCVGIVAVAMKGRT